MRKLKVENFRKISSNWMKHVWNSDCGFGSIITSTVSHSCQKVLRLWSLTVSLWAAVQVDGAGHHLLVSVLSLRAAAVTQLLRRVSKTVVVSVMQGVPAVSSHQPPPGRPMGHAAAGTASQMQWTAHVGEWVLSGCCRLLVGWRGGRGQALGWLGVVLVGIRHCVMMAVGGKFGVICFFLKHKSVHEHIMEHCCAWLLFISKKLQSYLSAAPVWTPCSYSPAPRLHSASAPTHLQPDTVTMTPPTIWLDYLKLDHILWRTCFLWTVPSCSLLMLARFVSCTVSCWCWYHRRIGPLRRDFQAHGVEECWRGVEWVLQAGNVTM